VFIAALRFIMARPASLQLNQQGMSLGQKPENSRFRPFWQTKMIRRAKTKSCGA
jgi:hypothetical protein